MLNFLSANNQKKILGISLTPGTGLEVVELDKNYSAITNYGRKKVEYNFSSREPQNYAELKSSLVEIIDEMKVQPKTPVYIVLPNVLFDFIEVPPVLTNEEIKTSILSETEKFYLFKKEEPYYGYSEVVNTSSDNQKRIAYTAFQKNVIEQIKEIIADIGLELVGIESSYSAILRGLRISGLCEDVISEIVPWHVMVVNTNSFTLFQMEGANLVQYNEVPIAIRSYSTEEAYDSIVSSASQLLSNKISSKLFIISQTDDISADILKRHMDFDSPIAAINSNRHSNQPVMEVQSATDYKAANSLTLCAVGAACIRKEFGIVLNVLASDPNAIYGAYFVAKIMGVDVEVTQELVVKLCITIAAFALIAFGGLTLVLFGISNSQKTGLDKINQEIGDLDTKISELQSQDNKQEIDINAVIDEITQANVTTINFYDSIATDIPKNVWLTKYYNKSGDKIAIRGIAQSIIDIYEYYKNLRIVSPASDIKLTELKVLTKTENQEDDTSKYINSLNINENDRLYSFEISNTQIDFGQAQNKDNQNSDNQNSEDNKNFSSMFDEINIIKKPETKDIEQPSGQMVPAK